MRTAFDNVPLLIWSILPHWLLSQSIYLFRFDAWDASDRPGSDPEDTESSTMSARGISLAALVTFLVLSVCLLLTVSGVAWFCKVPDRLLPVSSSSLMISAACHPQSSEFEPHLKPVGLRQIPEEDAGGPPRYSLSSSLLETPVSEHRSATSSEHSSELDGTSHSDDTGYAMGVGTDAVASR